MIWKIPWRFDEDQSWFWHRIMIPRVGWGGVGGVVFVKFKDRFKPIKCVDHIPNVYLQYTILYYFVSIC